ncbi:Putative RecA/RadA family phage recombinase [Hyphomicrobiales bacterium]|nr:Putative RecA/RadA family phage recombinase [Hyphomicrobiales bacterium]CAH1669248.1 putative RecA/RadA family phage recombinase [Hyphomicrobiales bacterium]
MKNYIQPGDTLTLPAPYAVASGDGALVGTVFGVATGTYANAEEGEFKTNGVFDLKKKASQAWTVGAAIYWDNTNKEATTTTTDNTKIGVAVLAVGSSAGETIGRVRLNGSF